ncbi:MAG: arginase family protein, partial [Chloroflexota bacterium]|nr:arginase family protein [Chloroflexota bacterium]
MAKRPDGPSARTTSGPDFAALNGWDKAYETYADYDLPSYVGPSTFQKLPWVTDPAELRSRKVDVAVLGAPFDDAVSHRSGARFGPRAIREANYATGSLNSLQLGVEPFEVLTVVDAGDANIIPAWIERGHALIYRKVREVAETGAIPIVLGGDHSITWPSATAVAE